MAAIGSRLISITRNASAIAFTTGEDGAIPNAFAELEGAIGNFWRARACPFRHKRHLYGSAGRMGQFDPRRALGGRVAGGIDHWDTPSSITT